MKRWNNYIGVGALLLLMVGCERVEEYVSLRLEHEQYVGGEKVYVDGEKYACWADGDSVKINSVGYRVEVAQEARINAVAWNENGYTAVYPANCVVGMSQDRVEMNWPSSYEYRVVEGTNSQALLNPMAARTNKAEGSLMFRNAGALVGIELTSGSGEALAIDKIQLEATGASLYGRAVMTNLEGENLSTTMSDGGSCALLWGIDKVVSGSASETFYLCIPPVLVEGNQFRVRVMFHKGEQYYEFERTTSTAVGNIGRNQYGTIPIKISAVEGDYIHKSNGLMGDGGSGNPFIVSDGGDLLRLKNYCEGNEVVADLNILQVADLVCPDGWNGIGKLNHEFKGRYDGGGHTITMNGTSSGLFDRVSAGAEIRNVTVKGSISIVSSSSQSIGAIVNQIDNATGNKVLLEHCTNEAIITADDFNSRYAQYYIGGICGYIKSSENIMIENCHNRSDILRVGVTDMYMMVGGICGYIGGWTADIPISLVRCSNESQIKVNSTNTSLIGGMVGQCKYHITMQKCVNKGDLIGSASVRKANIGGLIGRYEGECNMSMTACVNHGEIRGGEYAGGLVGLTILCRNIAILDSYADNRFGSCDKIGGVCGRFNVRGNHLDIKDVYVKTSFEESCGSKSWIFNETNIGPTLTCDYDNIYVTDLTTCGIIGSSSSVDLEGDSETDVFVIDSELTLNLNHGRAIWKSDGEGNTRLGFE